MYIGADARTGEGDRGPETRDLGQALEVDAPAEVQVPQPARQSMKSVRYGDGGFVSPPSRECRGPWCCLHGVGMSLSEAGRCRMKVVWVLGC